MADLVEQLPQPQPQSQQDVKLFNRWAFDDVDVC
jgi:hypothetical protein